MRLHIAFWFFWGLAMSFPVVYWTGGTVSDELISIAVAAMLVAIYIEVLITRRNRGSA